jgi:hypothetical protein
MGRFVRAVATFVIATTGLCVNPPPGSSAIDFATMYRSIPSAPSAAHLRVQDVDGDGIGDLLVIGSSTSIWIHRGLANGGYGPAGPLLSFAGNVTLWDVGDLNNDGKLDFVVADGTNTAWSILANGDGTFMPPRAILSLFWGACLRLGDLDLDGKLDLVAAQNFGPMYTLRGQGDGGFQLQTVITPPPVFPVDFAIADFNGDGKPDVMALDAGTDAPLTARMVDFFRGLGGGALAAPVMIPMPERPAWVRVGDIDQDGLADAMICNGGGGVTILYGTNSGPPFGRLDLPQIKNVGDFLPTDLDGDGQLELVVDSSTGSGHNIVILGRTGARSYTQLREYSAGTSLGDIGFTDVDHDGYRDFVVCNRDPSRLAVLRGHGGLEFGDGGEVPTVAHMWGLDVGDLNGDSFADVTTLLGSTSTAGVHLNRGDGSFFPMISTDGPYACCGLVYSRLADINGDGRLDLVGMVEFYNRLDVLLGDGAGHFGTRIYRSLGSQPYAMTIADFNEDGISDVAAACGAGIVVCLGTPSGEFNTTTLAGQRKYVRAADFNLDGHADLIATNSHRIYEFGSQVAVFLGHGNGTFTALPMFYAGYRPTNIAVGEINDDGIPDIAVANIGETNVACFLGVGDGTFVADSIMAGTWSRSLEFADLDGDGHQDLIAAMEGLASVRVWPGPGAGRRSSHVDFGTRTAPSQLRLADLDHDGFIDLVVEHESNGVFDVLLNRSSSLPTPVLASLVEARVSAGRVRLVWYAQGTALSLARVERRNGGSWREVGSVRMEGPDRASYEETPPPGDYDYQLTFHVGDQTIHAGQAHVMVTVDELTLTRCIWDESSGAFHAVLSLVGTSPARLELIDVSGRLVASESWVPLGGGHQEHDVFAKNRAKAGVFWARLSQNGRSVTRRLVVLR